MSSDDYRSFADDYHWFFDDVALRLGSDVPGVRSAIAGLPAAAHVLDAACGIGIDAHWLRRHGHSVAAADASAAMVAAARRRLDAIEVPPRVVCAEWARLGGHFEPASFDMVLCTGSAIAHAPDSQTMIEAFEVFRSLLRPNGQLVVDSHDWEVVLAAGSGMSVERRVVERDGARCVRSYSWHICTDIGEPVVFEPAVIVLDGDRARMRSYPIRLWPFTRRELRERLSAAGFERIGLDVMPGDDRYTAIAYA